MFLPQLRGQYTTAKGLLYTLVRVTIYPDKGLLYTPVRGYQRYKELVLEESLNIYIYMYIYIYVYILYIYINQKNKQIMRIVFTYTYYHTFTSVLCMRLMILNRSESF